MHRSNQRPPEDEDLTLSNQVCVTDAKYFQIDQKLSAVRSSAFARYVESYQYHFKCLQTLEKFQLDPYVVNYT